MKSRARLVVMAAAVATLAFAGPSQAASASATLAVSASVAPSCTISTSPLAFGSYDPIVTHAVSPLDGTGGVTITCTKGSTQTIELGLGSNASGSVRRLGASGSFLNYELYRDSSRTQVWSTGTGAVTPAAAPSSSPRTFSVYGRIAAGQDVPSGSYTDTVVATVNF